MPNSEEVVLPGNGNSYVYLLEKDNYFTCYMLPEIKINHKRIKLLFLKLLLL